MKKVTTDVAIRKNYFEDTIVILGDFNVAGHDMNYVLRVSSYGSKVNGQNVRVYFGLLDDTKREYSEYKQEYPGENVIIDDAHLLVRTDMIEINDSPEGLKLYINYETIVMDFLIKRGEDKIDIKKFGKSQDGGKVVAYAYPECRSSGHVTTLNNYFETVGNVFYIRHSQTFDSLFGFRKKVIRITDNSHFMFGFFKLSNFKKLMFGTFSSEEETTDMMAVMSYGDIVEMAIQPLRLAMMGFIQTEDKENAIIRPNIATFDDRVMLKCKTKLNINENMSPDDENFKMYDKFVRCVGTFKDSKVTGYGYVVLF